MKRAIATERDRERGCPDCPVFGQLDGKAGRQVPSAGDRCAAGAVDKQVKSQMSRGT